jgi:hypothetical protein
LTGTYNENGQEQAFLEELRIIPSSINKIILELIGKKNIFTIYLIVEFVTGKSILVF